MLSALHPMIRTLTIPSIQATLSSLGVSPAMIQSALTRSRFGQRLVVGKCLVLLGAVLVLSAPPSLATDAGPNAETVSTLARSFIETHCLACHQGERPEGRLALDRLASDLDDATVRDQWARVLLRVRRGEMPPHDQPQPSADEVQSLVAALTPPLQQAERAVRALDGRVVLRRLNRVEYENTIRDLLGIPIRIHSELPRDGTADGFDNAAAAQHTSSFLMEKYLEAADAALAMAIANRRQPPKPFQERCNLKDGHPVRSTTEKVYRVRDDGEVTCFCSSPWHSASISNFWPQDAGLYRFRISAYGVQSAGKPVTFRVAETSSPLTGKNGLVGYFDAPPDEPRVFEFVHYIPLRTSISILPYGLASAQTVDKVGADQWEGPGLAVQWVDVDGPLYDRWPPESHRRLFGEAPQVVVGKEQWEERVEVTSEAPRADAVRILSEFAREAFRRRVTEGDIAPYVAIFDARLAAGATFETAVRAGLMGMLVSPDFLFLQERPGRLDDYALASRLSYFLWSTMPDDELLMLAEQGRLSQPDVLREQVERLLTSPRAAAFTENFVGQWLGLCEIDATEPSHQLYPEFDHLLKVSMLRETELFFQELLREDLSLSNVVDSDFAMLNGRLAKHYGVSDIDGWEFQRVTLSADSPRGGVLTMASVLKVTANGTTTSPVLRGAWVLDRILGAPPPSPPDNVGAIDPDTRGATTIREQLAKHRSTPECATCHQSIDPPGFALESFDCIGGWRERYRSTGNGDAVTINGQRQPYLHAKPVDSAGETPDGRTFADVNEFKQLLLQDQERITRALTVKLIAYATGRAPQAVDAPAVDAIVAGMTASDAGLRSLVHAIVQSEFFSEK